MKKYIVLIFIFIAFFLLQQRILVSDDEDVILEIVNIYPEQFIMKAISLEKDLNLQIEAKIGVMRDCEELLTACWILNADTRTKIWECTYDNSKIVGRGRELQHNDKLKLAKGHYEVAEKHDDAASVQQYVPAVDEQVILQMVNLHDDQSIKKGFTLTTPLTVRIYAIGEGSRQKREMYDYGWIMNANTRERIWEMDHRNTQSAGGGEKNLKFDDTIQLPAGDYMVYFVTDDSHSASRWNVLPPDDPRHWGVTIWAVKDKGDALVVREYEEQEMKPIIDLTRIGDDQMEMESFSLKREAQLSIIALGEYSRSRHEFVDAGWIIDAATRKLFWKMEYENTEHAGGASKNRVFNNNVFFPAGKYLVYFQTDDSHSYSDWNESRPYQPEAWGIAIYPADRQFSYNDVGEYDESQDEDILAQIYKAGNDEHLKVPFVLPSSMDVRIYAIGEGDRSEMYDYGWIEDKWGHVVWEMKYRDTSHAGGAKKNRLVNEVIHLDRGPYSLHYRTDDSHAYHRWNADPPDDGFHWGIMLIKQD